jgi:hypothetical protein
MDILEPKAVTEGKLRTTVRGDLSSLGTNDWRSKVKQFDSHGARNERDNELRNLFIADQEIPIVSPDVFRLTIFVRPKSFVAL